MNAVIIHPGWRKAPRIDEEVTVLLQEVIQQWVLSLEGGRRQLKLWRHRGGALNALPPDASAESPESHRQGVEVPEDGTEGPQEVDSKDEVETAQVDARTHDGEVLVADGDGHVPREPMTPETIAVGHRDPKLLPARRLKR